MAPVKAAVTASTPDRNTSSVPPHEPPPMDQTDLDIVAALQIAPRVPANALADILGEPASTITRRLKRLQQDRLMKVIGRFAWPLVTSGNPRQLWFKCQPGQALEVAEKLRGFREIQFLLVTSGSADIYADLYPLHGSDINELLSRSVPSIPGVASIESQLVLESKRVGHSWRLDRLKPEQVAALEVHRVPVNKPPMTSIDELSDIEFGTLLQLGQNARVTAAEVARSLNISSSSAYRTIQLLLNNGSISPRVEMEPAAAGFTLHAIISLQVKPKFIAAALENLSVKKSARMVSMVTGKASIIYHGTFRGPDELAHFITDEIGALSGIQSIDTCVGLNVLRRYWMDRDGELMGDQVEGLLTR
ncbi:Lrp/AsnC family transcriptional regulator [Arthrobacter flavus]|uniref:Lrp/AsnC family transcriptional regulator n=1 Tax=Arthrobacter flavus TaxID=95172 RepID=A0ABW4Q814_9MICC